MPVGNVISLTPTYPGLPGRFDWNRAKPPQPAQESPSTDSDDPAPVRKRSRCSRSDARRENSGMSLWKPVVLTISCLNICALGGLVYSAPWKPKAEQEQTAEPSVRNQVQRKLLIPLEASITTDGKVSTRYPRDFLSSVPAAVRRSLLDSLREDASDEGAGSPASRESSVSRESIEHGQGANTTASS